MLPPLDSSTHGHMGHVQSPWQERTLHVMGQLHTCECEYECVYVCDCVCMGMSGYVRACNSVCVYIV